MNRGALTKPVLREYRLPAYRHPDYIKRHLPSAAALLVAALLLGGVAKFTPEHFGLVVLLVGIGAALAYAGIRSPVIAVSFMLIATFFRLAIPPILPIDLFTIAFVGVVVSAAVALARRVNTAPRLGAIEVAMVAYLLWNIYSMVSAHTYPATLPTTGVADIETTGVEISVSRFILTGTIIPFTLYLVGRFAFDSQTAIRRLLWTILALGAYSAAVSILQIHGPTELVWPRYIVEAPGWEGRAVGIFNQPVVNGLTLILSFTIGLLVASEQNEPRWRRVCASVISIACAYGVYLTFTRAVWLSLAIVVVIGIIYARGFRAGFVAVGLAGAGAIITNWSVFTSDNRYEGGVGSAGEIEDRLNTIATSMWAVRQEPFTGWGIGRFAAVNTYHHKQWSSDTAWERGFGITSHFNELGIAAELGLVGLGLWVVILLLLFVLLTRTFRRLRVDGLPGRGLVLVAGTGLIVLIVTGFSADLRYFDFANSTILLLVGVAIGYGDRLRTGAHA